MRSPPLCALLLALPACAGASPHPAQEDARLEVTETERAFARTMAERDLEAFSAFISEEAVFLSGPAPLRGKDAIVAFWSEYFADPVAPFSWEPEQVEVLDSGTLALSSGPVRDANGKLVARFTSIWRREADRTWRIVFDKGD